jgi:succinyldiaminopimelate transaminase
MNRRLRELQEYPMVRLERRKGELEAAGVEVFDFGTGDPREPTPQCIREAFLAAVPEVSQYPKVAGQPAMRRAAAGYLRARFGVAVDADAELLPTAGSKEAIFHLPLVLVEHPGARDLVVYGAPAYPVFEIGALFAQAQAHEIALGPDDSYLLDPDAIAPEVLARAAIVYLNYPHNPTGQLMPAALFERWVRARAEFGFVLVSDECYVDLWYEEPPRSLLEFGREGCLVLHSLSKRSGMTGYRSGFVAGDRALIAHYRRFRAGMGLAPTDPVQAAAAVAWSERAHVEERRALFARKREVFLARFAALGLEVYPGPSTLFLWVRVPPGRSDADYVDELLGHGILASPGSFFGRGQEGFFRLALVPSLEDCERAAARWPG